MNGLVACAQGRQGRHGGISRGWGGGPKKTPVRSYTHTRPHTQPNAPCLPPFSHLPLPRSLHLDPTPGALSARKPRHASRGAWGGGRRSRGALGCLHRVQPAPAAYRQGAFHPTPSFHPPPPHCTPTMLGHSAHARCVVCALRMAQPLTCEGRARGRSTGYFPWVVIPR
jgi:hypothetical protein